ncbi:MAG: BON domain-containing protein [Planctomycetota bacterium]|nr:MAG: BON domain-containing protein [Planctomycetota bacterium]
MHFAVSEGCGGSGRLFSADRPAKLEKTLPRRDGGAEKDKRTNNEVQAACKGGNLERGWDGFERCRSGCAPAAFSIELPSERRGHRHDMTFFMGIAAYRNAAGRWSSHFLPHPPAQRRNSAWQEARLWTHDSFVGGFPMRRFLFGVVIASVTTAMPAWAMGGDREIAKAVMTKLQQQKAAGLLRGFDIDLKVQEGVVYLDGRVASQAQYELVAQAASEVAGQGKLVNTLRVDGADQTPAAQPVQHPTYRPSEAESRAVVPASTGATPALTDAAVTDAVIGRLQKLQTQGHLRGFQLDVSCVGGDLLLSGHVSTDEQKAMVIDAARHTKGVTRVVDGIKVTRAAVRPASMQQPAPIPQEAPAAAMPVAQGPVPMQAMGGHYTAAPRYDQPNMPAYAWPSYAAHPNYAAVTYPKQYSPSAWPYIGPFYPYPQVPLGWRKVSLEWDDGLWYLDFTSK